MLDGNVHPVLAAMRAHKTHDVHGLVDQVKALCPQLANDEFKGAEEVFAVVITDHTSPAWQTNAWETNPRSILANPDHD